jgi:hypothetical protein
MVASLIYFCYIIDICDISVHFFIISPEQALLISVPKIISSLDQNNGTDDPINLLLEQALTRQRDEMMENFSHILKHLTIASGAYSSSGHFGGTLPLKLQVNFDIPIFEGQIDAKALEKWLTLIEGYFSVHNFSNKENITFALLKALVTHYFHHPYDH